MSAYLLLNEEYENESKQDSIHFDTIFERTEYLKEIYTQCYYLAQNGQFVRICENIHDGIRTHTYTYLHIHTHTYTYVHIRKHTYTYLHIHINTYTYVHICTHTYIHDGIRTHTYTYLHIRTHT